MEPVSSIESVEAELTRVLNACDIEVTASLSESDWESRLATAEIPEEHELHRSALCDEFRDNPWEWCYQFEDGASRIVITLYHTDPADVTATETSVRSPTLSGRWWAPVTDVKVSDYDGDARISFIPPVHFPVLIRNGPNIDMLSAHFLALISITALRDAKWFERWLIYAANLGEQNSQQDLGIYYVGLGLIDLAVYWLARCVREHNDEKAKLTLAILLWSEKSQIQNPPLAEHLLCELCNMGKPDAFLQLGNLLISGARGVPADVDRGLELLRRAAEEFNIPEAVEAIKAAEENQWTSTDVWLLAGVGAAAMAIGYGIYRRMTK